jgi:hypothetical protein
LLRAYGQRVAKGAIKRLNTSAIVVIRAPLNEANVELLSKLITDAATTWEQPAILTLAFVRNADDDGDVDGGAFMSKISRQMSRSAKGNVNANDDDDDDDNDEPEEDDGIDVEKLAAVTAAVAEARGNDALVTRDSTRDDALEKKIAEDNKRQRREAEKRAKKRAEKAKKKAPTRERSKQAPGVDALNDNDDDDDDDDGGNDNDDAADDEDVLSPHWFEVLRRLESDVATLPDADCARLKLVDPANELELIRTLGRGAMGVVRCFVAQFSIVDCASLFSQ